jgi:TPR repeat protein
MEELMRIDRRSFVKGAVVSLAVPAAPAIIKSASAADPIVVATMYDLSGGLESTGKPMSDVAAFAAEEINAKGGLPKDDREAARLYKLAADQGNAAGQAYLGIFYEQGRGGLPEDDREAIRLFKLAANQGNVYAQAGLKRLAP